MKTANNYKVLGKISLSKLFSQWMREEQDAEYAEPKTNWHLKQCEMFRGGFFAALFETMDEESRLFYRVLVGGFNDKGMRIRTRLRFCADYYVVVNFSITDESIVFVEKSSSTMNIRVCNWDGSDGKMPDYDEFFERDDEAFCTVIGSNLFFLKTPEGVCIDAPDDFGDCVVNLFREIEGRDDSAEAEDDDSDDSPENDSADEGSGDADDDEEEDDYNDSSNRKKDIGDVSREIAAKVQALKKPEEGEPSAAEKLEKLIGLANTKAKIREITAYARMQKRMEALGKNANSLCFNMVFTGNPGTAKTTVARLTAEILYEEGIIKKRKFMEVGRSDLVAVYLGQTAVKIKKVFKDIKGGVLFVDEAYSLFENYGDSNGYTDEALGTIVQEMENNRDTVVIFAGYPDEMETLLDHNPGLRSRFPIHIGFDDYSADELTAITEIEAQRRGFSIAPGALKKIESICSSAMNSKGFGNGRFCRVLAENAEMKHALSLSERMETVGEDELFTLVSDDFEMPSNLKKDSVRANLGFCA